MTIVQKKIIMTWAKVVISGDGTKRTVLRYVLRVDTIRLDDMGVRPRKK